MEKKDLLIVSSCEELATLRAGAYPPSAWDYMFVGEEYDAEETIGAYTEIHVAVPLFTRSWQIYQFADWLKPLSKHIRKSVVTVHPYTDFLFFTGTAVRDALVECVSGTVFVWHDKRTLAFVNNLLSRMGRGDIIVLAASDLNSMHTVWPTVEGGQELVVGPYTSLTEEQKTCAGYIVRRWEERDAENEVS